MMGEQGKNMKVRLYLVFTGFLVLAIAVLLSIFKIQIIDGNKNRTEGWELATDLRSIKATRGNIYSADGSLLATSIPIFDVRLDLKTEALTNDIFYDNVDSLAWSLSNYFKDKSEKGYRTDLINARKRGERYYLLKRGLDYNELQDIKTFPLLRRGRFKGCFIVEKQTIRKKPFNVLASRTIGYDRENAQRVGLEGAYNSYLAGQKGLRLEKRLAGGVWMPIGDDNAVDPQDGYDVYYTIDINFQDVAENALLKQLQKQGADHGCVVLMEVKTGKVKAIANLKRRDDGKYSEQYNYAVGEATEPGSTFKLASLMAAIDDGMVTINDRVDTKDGVFYYYDTKMTDSKKGGYGEISVQEVFEVSSNIGVSRIISDNYSKNPERFTNKLYSFGIHQKLGLNIPGEGTPKIKNPVEAKDWSGISLTQMSIGYELLLTPLQILAFYNGVANDGVLVKPSFVDKVEYNGKNIKTFEPEVLNAKLCSDNTLKQLRTMLEGVVLRGTAQNLQAAHFSIAGKTGTARIANSKYGYTYEGSPFSYQASFVGYFPADKPLYSCIVVVNAPSNYVYYGNLVAGPIFRELADKVYSNSIEYHERLNTENRQLVGDVPVSLSGSKQELEQIFDAFKVPYLEASNAGEWVYTKTKDKEVEMQPANHLSKNESLVPNVRGLGLEDALYLLENRGLKVKARGIGMVKRQSLLPGTRIIGKSEIVIELG